MEKEVVAKKKPPKKVASKFSRTKKAPMQKPEAVYKRGPGLMERNLMRISRILRGLLRFVEKKIQKLRTKRLSERMNRND